MKTTIRFSYGRRHENGDTTGGRVFLSLTLPQRRVREYIDTLDKEGTLRKYLNEEDSNLIYCEVENPPEDVLPVFIMTAPLIPIVF